jgi:hypothetical protein
MSDPNGTIDPYPKKEDTMNENEYGTPDFNITAPESTHPVLAKLYEQIAQLEKDKQEMRESNQSLQTRYYEVYANFNNYKFKLENVLRTYAQDNSATAELFVEIANEMDIELLNTKDFEITVTWNVTVTAPFDEEIELSEYDVDAYLNSVGGLDYEENDISTTVSEI